MTYTNLHTSHRRYLVSPTDRKPGHKLLTTMTIASRGDEVDVRFAAVEMPLGAPKPTKFVGLVAQRRKMDRL